MFWRSFLIFFESIQSSLAPGVGDVYDDIDSALKSAKGTGESK